MIEKLKINLEYFAARLRILILTAGILCSTADAQFSAVWTRVYDGPEGFADAATSCMTDEEGNIYIAGNSYSARTRTDFILLKFTPSGVIEWETKYSRGTYTEEICKSFTRDEDKNFYLAGSEGIHDGPIIVAKISKDGKKIWDRTYNDFTFGFIEVVSMVTDNERNVIVRGDDLIGGMTILKYDSAGTNLWVRNFPDFVSFICASNITVDKEGNIYACGDLYGYNDDIALVKYSPQGDTLWTRIYDSGMYEHSSDLELDDSGNVYISGETGGSPFIYYGYKYVTIKYDKNGNRIWLRRYDGGGNDRDCANNLLVGKDQKVYVTGESSGQWNNFDYATVKYNGNGDSIWTRRYNGQANLNDVGQGLCFDRKENLIVSGNSYGIGSSLNVVTVAYSPAGNQIGISEFNGPLGDDERFSDLDCSPSGEIVVCGTTKSFHPNNEDIFLIKYDLAVGIDHNSVEDQMKDLELHQNYPNPFNPTTTIKFEIIETGVVSLKIYDMLGKEVTELISARLSPGTYTEEFNSGNLPSGAYFYRLQSGEQVQTMKMLLLK
jgi:hypothetical protein